MDGGGRYLQPMTASRAGVAVARVSTYRGSAASSPPNFPSSRFRPRPAACAGAPPVFRSRAASRVISVSGLTLGFFAAVVTVGLWQGGHLDEFIRAHGEPHHALARLSASGSSR